MLNLKWCVVNGDVKEMCLASLSSNNKGQTPISCNYFSATQGE